MGMKFKKTKKHYCDGQCETLRGCGPECLGMAKNSETQEINLSLTNNMARIVWAAMIVESEGPRSDDRTEQEIKEIEDVIKEIESKLNG